jgi:hypothetical protein
LLFGRLFLALYLVSQSVTAKDHTLVQVNPDHRRAIGKGRHPGLLDGDGAGSRMSGDVPKSKIPRPIWASIAIVLATVGVKQRRVSGDDRCWSILAAPELWAFMVSSLAAGPSTARAGLPATGARADSEK